MVFDKTALQVCCGKTIQFDMPGTQMFRYLQRESQCRHNYQFRSLISKKQ